MNIKTSTMTGDKIVKSSNGMGIKKSEKMFEPQKGMGIKTGNGMEITKGHFYNANEYDRMRQYLFGDRGKGNPNKKPAPKPEVKKPEAKKPEVKKVVKVEEPKKEPTPEPTPVPPLVIPEERTPTAEPPTTRLPPLKDPPLPKLNGSSLGSMTRMLKLFNGPIKSGSKSAQKRDVTAAQNINNW